MSTPPAVGGLAMLSDGIVDLVISHAPETEARALAGHPGWTYRKIAYNRFVLVGPPSDPAGVRASKDLADAFRRIASQRAVFVSRGDESGTHERERALWAAAGVRPEDAQLQVSGQGMAVTLRQASEQGAYTLADQATFWQLERQIELVPVVEADPLLLNTYAVVPSRNRQHGGPFCHVARGRRWPRPSRGVPGAGTHRIHCLALGVSWRFAGGGALPDEINRLKPCNRPATFAGSISMPPMNSHSASKSAQDSRTCSTTTSSCREGSRSRAARSALIPAFASRPARPFVAPELSSSGASREPS